MSQIIDSPAGRSVVTADTAATQSTCPSRRRILGVGFGTGLLGGACCIGAAVAVGAGIGGLSFVSTWVERYQMYFVLASLLMMATWLAGLIRRNAGNGWRPALAAVARSAGRHLIAMGVVYVVTLGVAMAIARLAGVT